MVNSWEQGKIYQYPDFKYSDSSRLFTSWRLGFFNPNYLQSVVEVSSYCKYIKEQVTVHLDSMSTFSFMSPAKFDQFKEIQKDMTRPQIVNTGSGYFMVKKYVDLKFRNLSGDNVTMRFYCTPGLARDDKVEEDLKRYEDAGFIERAKDTSLHAANILVVQKKPPKNPLYD